MVLLASLAGRFFSYLNLNVIWAKHFFHGEEARFYMACSAMDKIILFLSGVMSAVMIPKVAKMHILEEDTLLPLNRCLLFAGILSGLSVAVFAISPGIIKVIFGGTYIQSADITGFCAAAMALFYLTWVIAQSSLAVNDLKYACLFAVKVLVIIALIRNAILQVAEVLVNFALFMSSYKHGFFGRGSLWEGEA